MVAVKINSPIALLKAEEKVSKIDVPISLASSTNVFHSISRNEVENIIHWGHEAKHKLLRRVLNIGDNVAH